MEYYILVNFVYIKFHVQKSARKRRKFRLRQFLFPK